MAAQLVILYMTRVTRMTMKYASVRATWAVAEARARFSDVIDRLSRTVLRLSPAREKAGLKRNSINAFVAVSAEGHGLTLVTRNVKNFERLGIPLLDPWAAPRGLIALKMYERPA